VQSLQAAPQPVVDEENTDSDTTEDTGKKSK